MIVMGVSNVISAFLVALFAKHVPREVVFGIGGIIHIGIMIGVQIWIPEKDDITVHFIVSASWGVCDAVWQTQCNSKYILFLFSGLVESYWCINNGTKG